MTRRYFRNGGDDEIRKAWREAGQGDIVAARRLVALLERRGTGEDVPDIRSVSWVSLVDSTAQACIDAWSLEVVEKWAGRDEDRSREFSRSILVACEIALRDYQGDCDTFLVSSMALGASQRHAERFSEAYLVRLDEFESLQDLLERDVRNRIRVLVLPEGHPERRGHDL